MSRLFIAFMLFGCAGASKLPDNGVFIGTNGMPEHWASVPIQVELDKSMTSIQMDAAQAAMDTWNDVTGYDIFSVGNEPRVFVSVADLDGALLGFTTNWEYGVIARSYVKLDTAAPPELYYDVFVHEFGHVLGLSHDDTDPGSVMYPYTDTHDWDIRQNDIDYIQSWVSKSL